MKKLPIDKDFLKTQLLNLLSIPSPVGYTDGVVHYVGNTLDEMGINFELTRRGAIRADLPGKISSPDRALVAHLDTLGAAVKNLKENGRLELLPIGSWSSRFAEGARVTLFTSDKGSFRGTILPLKASGHAYGNEVETLEVSWKSVELRIDQVCNSKNDLQKLGINPGDFIAVDPQAEVLDSGYIVSRYLDDKAGVAALLATTKALLEAKVELPIDLHLLFTISEEVGSGASSILHKEVAEMVTIDMAPLAPNQNSSELGVTIAMFDASGPFDYHLTHKLLDLCNEQKILHTRDVFTNYFCDSASALEAGNDIRTALACFGVDASHGYERCHIDSLVALSELLTLYAQSGPTFMRDKKMSGPLKGFPNQS